LIQLVIVAQKNNKAATAVSAAVAATAELISQSDYHGRRVVTGLTDKSHKLACQKNRIKGAQLI